MREADFATTACQTRRSARLGCFHSLDQLFGELLAHCVAKANSQRNPILNTKQTTNGFLFHGDGAMPVWVPLGFGSFDDPRLEFGSMAFSNVRPPGGHRRESRGANLS